MARKTAERIESVKGGKQQLENEIRRLQREQRKEERKARDKRLYRRGAYIESLVDGSPEMTRAVLQAHHKRAEQAQTHGKN